MKQRDAITERAEAERKALDALARYKFVMFGYWAGVWVHMNRVCPQREPNPFSGFVREARRVLAGERRSISKAHSQAARRNGAKGGRPAAPLRISWEEIDRLRNAGRSYNEIGRLAGISGAALFKRIKRRSER